MIFLDREISPVFFAITVFPPSQMKIERKSTRIQHVIHGLAKIVAGPTKTHKQTKKRFQFSFVSHSLTRRPSQNGVWASFFFIYFRIHPWNEPCGFVCVSRWLTRPPTTDRRHPEVARRKGKQLKRKRAEIKPLRSCCTFVASSWPFIKNQPNPVKFDRVSFKTSMDFTNMKQQGKGNHDIVLIEINQINSNQINFHFSYRRNETNTILLNVWSSWPFIKNQPNPVKFDRVSFKTSMDFTGIKERKS